MKYEILEIRQSGEIINYGEYERDQNGSLEQIHALAEHLNSNADNTSRFVVGTSEKIDETRDTISRKIIKLIIDSKVTKILDAIYLANLHSQKADQVFYQQKVDAFLFVYEDKSNLTIQVDGNVFCDFEECEFNLFE